MKQSCLLKITWPNKAIPTKSYSLDMLYLHHTKYLIMHKPGFSQAIVSYFSIFKLFQSSCNT